MMPLLSAMEAGGPGSSSSEPTVCDGFNTPKKNPILPPMVSSLLIRNAMRMVVHKNLVCCRWQRSSFGIDFLLLLSLQFVPACDDAMKPVVGMKFDSLQAVGEFYKAYAHEVGFSVRIGAQGKVISVSYTRRIRGLYWLQNSRANWNPSTYW
jgi:hypothetical protein